VLVTGGVRESRSTCVDKATNIESEEDFFTIRDEGSTRTLMLVSDNCTSHIGDNEITKSRNTSCPLSVLISNVIDNPVFLPLPVTWSLHELGYSLKVRSGDAGLICPLKHSVNVVRSNCQCCGENLVEALPESNSSAVFPSSTIGVWAVGVLAEGVLVKFVS
jgi:hypothetical protein